MMNDEVLYHHLCGLTFSIYTGDELRKLSVKEITNPQSFDSLMHPTYGGLYDPALGPSERDEVCSTCGQNNIFCPGHMGHIQLPLPVYNPVFFRTMFQILQQTCFTCHRIRINSAAMALFVAQLRILEYGLITEVEGLNGIYQEMIADRGGHENIVCELRDILEQHITDVLRDADIDELKKRSHVKNVTESRQHLVKEFMRGKYISSKPCPHCQMPIRALRSEHHSKIFFFRLGRKQALELFNKEQQQQFQQKQQQSKDASPNDMVQRDEMNELGEVVVMEEPEKKTKNPDHEKQIAALMGEHSYLTPVEVKDHLEKVFTNDGDLLKIILGALNVHVKEGRSAIGIFFLDVVPVPPTRFRPISVMKEKRFDNPQSANLAKLLKDRYTVLEILNEMKRRNLPDSETILPHVPNAMVFESVPGTSLTEKLQNAWIYMQTHVNCVYDSELDKLSDEKQPGIRQLLEKKEGLFRKHMMGKRVNYAARSVISPDPYIATNEIGIPDYFAKKLTYPQPVTPWNFQEMKQAVINGPDIHPGASFVINEDGSRVMLTKDKTAREAIAKQLLTPSHNSRNLLGCKKVYRHLRNGDVMLLNRQPTLHRPSIQAHKARILPGEKTLRLHYANCKAYNADFDGDEMNAHFPQDEISRAEAYTLACTDFQYLVPKDGTPLAGLIQDHMVSGVWLTIRGRFFKRAEYHQLVYSGLTDRPNKIKLLPPTILKPHTLWSGKQVLSSVLLNIIPGGKPPLNLSGRAKVSSKSWINAPSRSFIVGGQLKGDEMSESEVVIRDGELLVGVLDKGHYGNTPYGLVHTCYELYGGEVAGLLLTCLAKLFTTFLQYRGFTLGVEDILCTPEADVKRKEIMKKSKYCGPAVAAKALHVESTEESTLIHHLRQAHFSKDGNDMKDLDLCMKGQTDEFQTAIAKVCMPLGLEKKFPYNNLQLMVVSGAKGSSVNCMQISCLLGQIELEGRRPPLMISGQSLPSFLAYDMAPRAGGYIDGRFLTGIRPQEYFFHCMAGREGLIDTAVKTSRSGYLQRCLIKHLEGLIVNYDLSVRDSDGSIVQFQYGDDGLEICKTPYLTEKQFPFLISNAPVLDSSQQLQTMKKCLNTQQVPKLWDKFHKWHSKNEDREPSDRRSGFLRYCRNKWNSVLSAHSDVEMDRSGKEGTGHSQASIAMVRKWRKEDADGKRSYIKKERCCPDPVISQINPSRHFGAVSERMDAIVNNYIKSNPHKMIQDEEEGRSSGRDHVTSKYFQELIYMRSAQALVQPGEAVGLVAAQSIGEPSTQMTLNTFHFAGRGEMNVTLGIPRLREILMVASANIKTPSMEMPFRQTHEAFVQANKIKLKLTKTVLSEVLEHVEVNEILQVKDKSTKARLYRLRFSFLPPEVYRDEINLTPATILQYMEKKFFRLLDSAIRKKTTEIKNSSLLTTAFIRTRSTAAPQQQADVDAGDISDDDLHDDDATATKRRERQMEDLDYQGEDEERGEAGEHEDPESEAEDLSDNDAQENADGESGESRPTTPEFGKTPKKKKPTKEMSSARIAAVQSLLKNAVEYKYDASSELWCEITLKCDLTSTAKLDMTSLIEKEAKKIVIYQTPGISRCFISDCKQPGKEGVKNLKTEGINITEMYKYRDVLDLDQLYSNDIHAVARHYGIEAACRVIIKEIRDVFAAYGITVDYRHLSLVADYMTFEGVYKAFNRGGIESNASPLQKMTFETTMQFLKTATILGMRDDLQSPSARLITGQLVKGGTGTFDIVQSLI